MGKSERVSFQRKCLLVSLCSGTPTSPSATPPPGGAIPAVQATAEAGGENGQVVISYAAWDYERQIYEPLAKKFMDENPGPDYSAFGALSQAIEATLGPDKKDPQKALQEAQKQLLQQLADAAQNTTPTPTPNTGPVVVATPEPQAAPEGATPVKFAAYGYSPSDLRRLARSFRDQYPEIFVTIQSTDTFTETPTFAQLAKTSDCFSWWSPPQTDDDFKALLDLQPLFDADASFPQSDYAPALLAPYQRSGGLFGLPYAATLRTLTYNKTAFDAAGIKPPTYQWKPDDFLAAAQALTRGEGDKKQFGYVPLGGAQQDMLFFVGQFGGQLIGGSGKDVRPNFTDPKVVQALQWYLDLSTVHKVMPPLKFQYQRDDQGFEDKSYELVQGGRAGMWFDQGYGMFGGPHRRGAQGWRAGRAAAAELRGRHRAAAVDEVHVGRRQQPSGRHPGPHLGDQVGRLRQAGLAGHGRACRRLRRRAQAARGKLRPGWRPETDLQPGHLLVLQGAQRGAREEDAAGPGAGRGAAGDNRLARLHGQDPEQAGHLRQPGRPEVPGL